MSASLRPPRGNVLLLALFAMSSILLGGMAVGTLVLREIRAARSADASQVAAYAAESGNERALYEIRKLGTSPGALAAGAELDNGASYAREIVREPAPIFTTIAKDGVYELVLYDPAATPPSGGVAQLVIDWDAACGAASVIEISSVTFEPGVGWTPSITKFRYANDGPVTYVLSNPGANAARVRLKAERCDAVNVRIDAIDAGGAPAAFPDRVAIVSTGEYAGTRQASQVVAPTVTTLSGLFDFVLFSECEIVKGGAPPMCP
ncbi:hypothetical protein EPO33_00215 [Patescibacteria group bacterium]|nr:MAG: hypothetical protein EPO33_00215 [Patescibacteria group bacterium]